MFKRALTAAVALLVIGCHAQSPAVQLQGAQTEIGALGGTWMGSYTGRETGRSGSIVFTVTPRGDSARGDVVMNPTGQGPLLPADAASGIHQTHARAADVLQITFVRVGTGTVEGMLEPYVAPDCKCVVTTVFRGTIKGNAIDGEFTTRGPQGLEQRGTWRVERER